MEVDPFLGAANIPTPVIVRELFLIETAPLFYGFTATADRVNGAQAGLTAEEEAFRPRHEQGESRDVLRCSTPAVAHRPQLRQEPLLSGYSA